MNKFVFFLLLLNCSYGQTISKAKIKTVDKDGLYIMKIPSLMRSYSNNNLGDLRIYDSKNQEIPYFTLDKDDERVKTDFIPLKIVSKKNVNKNTEVIFLKDSNTIEDFIIEFANTQTIKTYNITGSNDKINWYSLVDKDSISLNKNIKNTNIFKAFEIPMNDYQYIKITFDNSKTLPINILKVGYNFSKFFQDKKDEIFTKNIKILTDSNSKKTTIEVKPRLRS